MTSTERSLNGKTGSLKLCDEYTAFDHDCPAKCSNSKYPIPLKDDFKRSKFKHIVKIIGVKWPIAVAVAATIAQIPFILTIASC